MFDVRKEKLKQKIQSKYTEFKQHEHLVNQAVEDKWIQILDNEYLTDTKEKIYKLQAHYQLQLDRCDSVVKRLQDWIEENEEQYQFNLLANRRTLNDLHELSQKRLKTERERWESRLKTIVDDFEDSRSRVIKNYQDHVSEMRNINSAIGFEYKERRDVLDNKFRFEKDALTMRSQESISALNMHLMEQITQVNEQMKLANKEYKEKSENKMTQFHQLFEEHKKMQREMRENEKAIAKHAADISHWRRKIKNNMTESKEENDRLRQEKETLSLHFRKLKDVMARFRATEAAKLAEISVAFEDTINALQKKLQLADNILKYSEMTRKLETEREQIIPFPNSIADDDPEIQRQMRNFKLQLKGDSKYVEESDVFDKFYRRYNKCLLDTLSLQREKAQLTEENKYYKNLLQKYMENLGVREDAVNKPNTIVIVNQNTNAPKSGPPEDTIPTRDVPLVIHQTKLQGY